MLTSITGSAQLKRKEPMCATDLVFTKPNELLVQNCPNSYVLQAFTVQELSCNIAADCIQNATREALLGHSAYPIQDLCESPHKRTAMWQNPCKSMYMSQSNILKAKARKRTQSYKTNASAWHAHPVVHYILYICTLS